MKEPVRHYRTSLGMTCGADSVNSAQTANGVTCKRCLYVMLCAGEVRPTDSRVTEAMCKRAGYHWVRKDRQ